MEFLLLSRIVHDSLTQNLGYYRLILNLQHRGAKSTQMSELNSIRDLYRKTDFCISEFAKIYLGQVRMLIFLPFSGFLRTQLLSSAAQVVPPVLPVKPFIQFTMITFVHASLQRIVITEAFHLPLIETIHRISIPVEYKVEGKPRNSSVAGSKRMDHQKPGMDNPRKHHGMERSGILIP